MSKIKNLFSEYWIPEKLKRICLTKQNPCIGCKTNQEYLRIACYGSIAERQYMETPTECNRCEAIKKHQTLCLIKLMWYEGNDLTLH